MALGSGLEFAASGSVMPSRKPKPPFTPQHQARPGIERRHEPSPRFDAPDYRGSGKPYGHVALITGGDSGIGRAAAVMFTRECADVAVVYLPDEQEDAEMTEGAVVDEDRVLHLERRNELPRWRGTDFARRKDDGQVPGAGPERRQLQNVRPLLPGPDSWASSLHFTSEHLARGGLEHTASDPSARAERDAGTGSRNVLAGMDGHDRKAPNL